MFIYIFCFRLESTRLNEAQFQKKKEFYLHNFTRLVPLSSFSQVYPIRGLWLHKNKKSYAKTKNKTKRKKKNLTFKVIRLSKFKGSTNFASLEYIFFLVYDIFFHFSVSVFFFFFYFFLGQENLLFHRCTRLMYVLLVDSGFHTFVCYFYKLSHPFYTINNKNVCI